MIDGSLHRFQFCADGETLAALRVGHGIDGVVVLHGAGTSHKERALPFMLALADLGYSAWALDFSGHGEPSGRPAELSLERRAPQAAALCAVVAESVPLVGLAGLSMSGQTVTDLLAEFESAGVCLLNPAAYAPHAHELRFGPAFTQAIRRPESWVDSHAFAALAAFDGGCVLVTSEADEVIPAHVFDRYERAGRIGASTFERIVLSTAPHAIAKWLDNNPLDRNRIAGAFHQAMQSGTDQPAPR